MKHLQTYENILARFKVGDIITCIRPSGYVYLNAGETYLVTSSEGDLISVKGNDKLYNRTRFILATPEEIQKYNLKSDINKYNL